MSERLGLFVLDDDGVRADEPIGWVELSDDGATLTSGGSAVARDGVRRLAELRGADEVTAFRWLHADPWTNTRLTLEAVR